MSFGKPSNFCWRGAGKRGAAGVRRGAGGVQERSGEAQERCRRGAGEVRRGAMQAQHVTTSDSFIYKHIKASHSFAFAS